MTEFNGFEVPENVDCKVHVVFDSSGKKFLRLNLGGGSLIDIEEPAPESNGVLVETVEDFIAAMYELNERSGISRMSKSMISAMFSRALDYMKGVFTYDKFNDSVKELFGFQKVTWSDDDEVQE